ncbi:hypothetical protein Bca52824_076815 [Brassica carinata]|uniref:Non-specific phospholipase C6 n=1 Tax=Brassica carinata TaxID=52824 RepID=A0A8X7TXW9_BRACI|nr:hypothetical protein Bca52824_076815 [Brassica carinata]
MKQPALRFASTFSPFLALYCLLTLSHVALGSHQWQSPIKTVVVLVLENRSFDHLLGWMKKSVNPSINGVTGQECNPVPNSTQTICFTSDAEFVDPDPGHSFAAVEQQVFGSGQVPSMMGFVEQALSMPGNLSETVMKGFRPEAVPVYAELVKEFAVFDPWFSSIPGPTQPNRLFVYSATSHGSTSHVKQQLAQGFPQETIFDSLHSVDVDFGIYFQNIPTTLFYRNLRQLKYIFKLHQYDLKFKKDAAKGNLPSLTVIEPRYFNLNEVVSAAKGPTESSEFEHSSIPATIKKLFNLSSNYLTHRDAWAATFEDVVSHLTSPRTDCPMTLPAVSLMRATDPKEDAALSEFQSEMVQLAAVLNGDHFLSSFPDEVGKKMTVKQAHEYVKGATSRFIRASKEAVKLGADKSAIVDMRSSLTTRLRNL